MHSIHNQWSCYPEHSFILTKQETTHTQARAIVRSPTVVLLLFYLCDSPLVIISWWCLCNKVISADLNSGHSVSVQHTSLVPPVYSNFCNQQWWTHICHIMAPTLHSVGSFRPDWTTTLFQNYLWQELFKLLYATSAFDQTSERKITFIRPTSWP